MTGSPSKALAGIGPAPATRPRSAHSYGAATLVAVVVILALRLALLAAQPDGLYPDEAQYWFWAQHPAFGYYSKPPLVVWLIALTTGVLGNSEFAVRLAAPLLHTAAALLIYAIAARLYDRRTGFWSALAYATLPGVSLSAFIISTDAALLPLWAAALYCLIRARDGGAPRGWWAATGIAIGFGLLAKYAMAYWLISAFGLVLLVPGERRHLPGLLAATGIGIVIYLPNLWWNWSNNFVSYLHLRDNADLTGSLFHPLALARFFGSQFGVFGPLLFAALIVLVIAAPRQLAAPHGRVLAIFTFPALALMLAEALLARAEPNWAAPAYIAGTVLVVGWVLARGWRGVLIAAIAVNAGAAVLLFETYPALTALGFDVPAHFDPLHRLRGWHTLGGAVGAALAAHPGLTLLTDDRELVAALIYNVHPHPFDAAKWNPTRRIKDQWDLTNDLSRHLGDSFLVVSEHFGAYEAGMRRSFAALHRISTVTLTTGPASGRSYVLLIAHDFLGYPHDPR